jgi:hypothetical protein
MVNNFGLSSDCQHRSVTTIDFRFACDMNFGTLARASVLHCFQFCFINANSLSSLVQHCWHRGMTRDTASFETPERINLPNCTFWSRQVIEQLHTPQRITFDIAKLQSIELPF